MFIREYVTINKKTQTKYVTHRLVESIKTEKGPRQRIIMHLGTLSLPKTQWRKLAAILESRLAGQVPLFEEQNPDVAQVADQAMSHYQFIRSKRQEKVNRQTQENIRSVDLNSATTGDSRSLGPELVANAMWKRLDFETILKSCGFDATHISLAKAVIIGRLVAPSSDLDTWKWFRKRTALAEMTPVDVTVRGKDAFYEITDALFAQKNQLEQRLRNNEVTLFSLQTTLFLYDLTNTYFEGDCQKNELAKRGKSKENRMDCPLVTLALVVDQFGFPVFSQIYSGNQSEPKTLQEILNQVYQDGGLVFTDILPTIVMDRGIATRENIALIQSLKYPYIVIERRTVEKEYEEEFANARETFERIDKNEGKKPANTKTTRQANQTGPEDEDPIVYVKKIPWEQGCRILCLSVGREKKEQAMDALKEKRFLEDITRLKTSVANKNIVLVDKVAERIGKIKGRYPTVTRYYEIKIEMSEDSKKVMSVTWDKKPTREKRSTLTGCYVIETTHENMTAKEIWQHYMTLNRVESAFSDLKTELGMRPVYHHLAERTQAHLFVSVLAYHLLISIEHQLRGNGDHREWMTIKKELSTHQRNTIIVTDNEQRIHHIRVSGMPEVAHQEIYKLLGVKDPLKQKRSLAGSRK